MGDTQKAIYGEMKHGYHRSVENYAPYLVMTTMHEDIGANWSDHKFSINIVDMDKFIAGDLDSRLVHIHQSQLDEPNVDMGRAMVQASYGNGILAYGPTNNKAQGDIKYFDMTI